MLDFDKEWERNRRRIGGLLVCLLKDIDLADDLLQEAYLRARSKLHTYRGGDSGAWLSEIARNVALARLRRAYVRSEIPISTSAEYASEDIIGTDAHVDAILVRRAVDRLSSTLRCALILKHYGGFSYPEIAARLECPVGTAKRRVWTAIRQLRNALGATLEAKAMTECPVTMLVDYAYGTLPEAKRTEVEAHLADCESCRTQLEDVRRVAAAFNDARDLIVFVNITDMLADGSSVTYSSFRETNGSDQPSSGYSVGTMPYHQWQSVFVDGEEAAFTVTKADEDEFKWIRVRLNHTMTPGESIVHLGIFTTPRDCSGASFDIGFGRRVGVPENSGTTSSDHLLVQMLRLPDGAKLIGAVPAVDEVREGSKTTLVWRRLMRVGETRERPVVVYSQ